MIALAHFNFRQIRQKLGNTIFQKNTQCVAQVSCAMRGSDLKYANRTFTLNVIYEKRVYLFKRLELVSR